MSQSAGSSEIQALLLPCHKARQVGAPASRAGRAPRPVSV